MSQVSKRTEQSITTAKQGADASIQTFAPYLLNRIVHRYNQSVQKVMRARGLNIPKMRAIAALASQGDLTVNDLTVYAVSEQSTMSGYALHSEIWPDMLAAEADMFKGIKAKDKAALLDTLGVVLRNIRINDF